jgi:hypothetical protein
MISNIKRNGMRENGIPDGELLVEREVFAVDDVAAGADARIFAHEFTGGGLLLALVTIEEDEDGGL